ncbi:MAG TPA: glutamine-hydrolyzing carbamoyl-phosphate synthase small subunit [Candidatus Omnitrophota bacterium]|nr:glutamine-hydrolyzing carbamoyl-phosphate synthase small subunit [Candidatus Omnitrophota bacterium]HPT07273.1 glutamine-hydrolyzing carbamoyl-phosphate synthase small subunit [Candidatus Omnitrophota bacterium]
MEAWLVLEDGSLFRGRSFGAAGETRGEVVFNTSMTGYQEIITDPSYKGQIVTMTYPLIGNYGVNNEDVESYRPFVDGFVVKEYSKVVSNWRATQSLGDYLNQHTIIGIEGIDTRALTLRLRQQGALNGVISTIDLDEKSLLQKARNVPSLVGRDLVKEVVVPQAYEWNKEGTYKVVVLDCGIKYNTLRLLASHGCKVYVVPAVTSAEDILALKPDGLMLSNGPGDPAAVGYVVATVKKLLEKLPIFGICLGQQMLGQAFGGKTYKLKFGHHGGNHPVKDLRTGRVAITVQNHGFCVDIDSLNKKDIEITHINLNDNTLEGIRHKKLPIFSTQFHPEAAPGPHDARYLFQDFVDMMSQRKRRK